ncbi:unnamed protein product [Ambrosiozyma monospora]|uniref:Unnamed protein product n=1 Tax=Ambrosiozyma monospora TaxID=43982 RepID=A0ACB5SZI7_AMBMO|nr:unnamed protein product [Ambrosiozyma monospora]
MGYYLIECSQASSYNLVFDFQGFNIQVPLANFLINFVTPKGQIQDWCGLSFQKMSSDDRLILGDDFMSGVYTVVDLDDNVIALGLAEPDSHDENIEAITDSIPSATSAALYSETWSP